jgi:hypothetical protein
MKRIEQSFLAFSVSLSLSLDKGVHGRKKQDGGVRGFICFDDKSAPGNLSEITERE